MTLNRHTHYCLEFAANHIRFKQTFSLSSVFERAIITVQLLPARRNISSPLGRYSQCFTSEKCLKLRKENRQQRAREGCGKLLPFCITV